MMVLASRQPQCEALALGVHGLRWTAAAMLENGLRKLKACKQLPWLRTALDAHAAKASNASKANA